MISNRNDEIPKIVLNLQAGHDSLKHHLLSGQVQKYPLADSAKGVAPRLCSSANYLLPIEMCTELMGSI